MLFVGHRGASARSPENTMAALTLACALSDGFECDLQQLRSGNLVTLHDATLWRTATFPNRNGLASLFLRACPVGWLDDAAVADADVGNGEAPPRVDEIMGLALDRQKICFAELKAPEGASAAEVDALACAAAGAAPAGLDHLLTWISFSPDLCEAMKQKSPDHKAFLVAYVHDEAGCRAVAADAAKRGLDGIDVNAGSHVTRAVVDECAALNLKVVVYVYRAPAVNDVPALWASSRDAGVWAFTSNLPAGVDSAVAAN